MLQIQRKSVVGLFFFPLSNSDGLSCLLCKCCQKVFSADSRKQKYTTSSQRLHPFACLKVEKTPCAYLWLDNKGKCSMQNQSS